MAKNFFPPRPGAVPKIYAYTDTNPDYNGLLKIGYTTGNVQKRVEEQYPTVRPGELPYSIVYEETAMRNDGSYFKDHEVHKYLRARGIENPAGEWFKCTVPDLRAAVIAILNKKITALSRTQNFVMRPEQQAAVERTAEYFTSFKKQEPDKTPHFLWNAKMRFGKTFAAYQLAKKLGWKRLLVITFKPAVKNAWEEDLKTHIDFEGWQFVSSEGPEFSKLSKNRPIVFFGSFQDLLGKNEAGGIKVKNEWVHATNWDCVILDEYHFGAWRENAKDLFENEDPAEQKNAFGDALSYYDEVNMPITPAHYLYLSGTPFRAIATGEFIEEQIFNWTYTDEQRSKAEWVGPDNPYLSLPRLVMLTYQLPESVKAIAKNGEFDEFDLNEFFSATFTGKQAYFKYENEVQKWLDIIRGADFITSIDQLKLGAEKPPLPFSDKRLLSLITHTFWFLPSVASCHAMAGLLKQRQNTFYHDFKVIVAAGKEAGIGHRALEPVLEAMRDPLKTKTITLSCGKLTTGVTVKPWSGIFMLRNTSSPETYFQAAFRVQSPWVVANEDGLSPNKETILKEECYIFDFAPDRALKQIADYSCRLDVNESNAEKKVEEFIKFLPVLAYDGSSMRSIDAAGVLEMALSGTTATLLAKKWESALLVNVDNETLKRLMANEEALQALRQIEAFRNINKDLETIINKSEIVKKLKKAANEKPLTKGKKKELTEEEKKMKSLRKEVQDNLIKFATRIPVFMYLTDFRERKLKDIITQLEPGLFKKVTGLSVKDFELLVSLNIFNGALMNDAVYKFKRYEDSSLSYTGLNRHTEATVGLYDTTLSRSEYQKIFVNEE